MNTNINNTGSAEPQYFTLAELTRSATAAARGIDNTPGDAVRTALRDLTIHVLDPARRLWGAPLHVTSGYRSPALNRAVGGARNSQHIIGQAADITTGTTAGNLKLLAAIRASAIPYDQLINEHSGRWIHISHDPTRTRRQYLTLP